MSINVASGYRSAQRRVKDDGNRVSAMRGFTLIELMIVVVIVAILATAAIASYQFAVVKSRRATAETCLVERSQYMERFYTLNLRYDQDAAGAAIVMPAGCASESQGFYTFDFSAAPTATTFTLRASPVAGAQDDTKCGVLTIDNTGARTPTTEGCW